MGKDFLNVNIVKNNVCGKKYYLLGGLNYDKRGRNKECN